MTSAERVFMPGLEDETDGLYCRTCREWLVEGADHAEHHIAPAVLSDRFILNPLTGEIFEMIAPEAPDGLPFVVWDRGSAEWVLERISEAELELDALRRRREILLDNLDAMARPLERRVEWLRARFGEGLEKWAREELAGGKTRTLRTPFGTISFRKTRPRLNVIDEAAALEWARVHAPEAIKTSEKLLVSIVAGLKPRAPLPPAIEELPAGETCSIKTGVDDDRR